MSKGASQGVSECLRKTWGCGQGTERVQGLPVTQIQEKQAACEGPEWAVAIRWACLRSLPTKLPCDPVQVT